MRSEYLYALVMVATGVFFGLVVAAWPALGHTKLPPLLWILGVSLAFDLALFQVQRMGRGNPLPMTWRAVGFVVSALIYLLLSAVLAGRIW